MKLRRHHNNKGVRQIKNGGTRKQVRGIAKKLGIPYGEVRQLRRISEIFEAL